LLIVVSTTRERRIGQSGNIGRHRLRLRSLTLCGWGSREKGVKKKREGENERVSKEGEKQETTARALRDGRLGGIIDDGKYGT